MAGSSFQQARWLRRLWSLAQPDVPQAAHVANVQIVNDRKYSSSRERAPYACAWISIAAAGAGENNYIEIGGTDAFTGNGGPIILIQNARAQSASGLLGLWSTPNAVTTATVPRTAVAVQSSDQDDELTPTLFRATCTLANIPAAATAIPAMGTASATEAAFWLNPTELGFALVGSPGQSLYLFASNTSAITFMAVWQAMRS